MIPRLCFPILFFVAVPTSFGALLPPMNVASTWTPGASKNDLGLTEFRFGVTLPLPDPKLSPLTGSFFVLTPSFAYTSVRWNDNASFPCNLYNAGFSVMWMKPLNERWDLMVNVAPSYAADGKAKDETVRCPVIFGATWTPDVKWKIVFGAAYLDRSDIPVIPFGGFSYTPNDDWKFECMAPQPRIARRLTTLRRPDDFNHWVYLGLGFGGGAWRIDSIDRTDLAQYREYSVLLGYEFNARQIKKWCVEAAFLFGREMQFKEHTQPDRHLGNSLALRFRGTF